MNNCTVCDINEPLPVMRTFPDFHNQIMAAKTKQQMLNACAAFISFHGGLNKEVRHKLLGK